MDKLESIRADLVRSLVVRLKRVDHTTAKGNRTGSLPELTAAEKDVERATERLGRAKLVHAQTTAAVQEYADALKANGGTPELPEWFSVYTVPDVGAGPADELDAQGSPTDPEREPEPNNGDDEDDDTEPVQGSAPRTGNGRFVTRGSVV